MQQMELSEEEHRIKYLCPHYPQKNKLRKDCIQCQRIDFFSQIKAEDLEDE